MWDLTANFKILCVCMPCMQLPMEVPLELEPPRRLWVLWGGCREPNSGRTEEHQAPLITESSLQFYLFSIFKNYFYLCVCVCISVCTETKSVRSPRAGVTGTVHLWIWVLLYKSSNTLNHEPSHPLPWWFVFFFAFILLKCLTTQTWMAWNSINQASVWTQVNCLSLCLLSSGITGVCHNTCVRAQVHKCRGFWMPGTRSSGQLPEVSFRY